MGCGMWKRGGDKPVVKERERERVLREFGGEKVICLWGDRVMC